MTALIRLLSSTPFRLTLAYMGAFVAAAALIVGFIAWRAYVAANPDLACGKLLARACPHLSAAEAAAYDAPFPDARYKAGVRRFPPMVMALP